MRYGELTAFEERPHSPYYGYADATPLFVVLMDEYERWSGDTRLVRELEYEARAALDLDRRLRRPAGHGYISYQRRNEKTGLENQCWKDSWDSISFHDGTLPGFPRATCELQGYAYDAKVRGARLAREIWRESASPSASSRRQPSSNGASTAISGCEDGQYFARRARPRRTAGRHPHLEQRAPAVERDRRQVEGEGGGRPPAWEATLLRLGRPHAGRGRGPLQPDRVPRRDGLAVRQLLHRLGSAPLRLQGRSRPDRGGDPGKPPSSSTGGCPRRSAATPGAGPSTRCSTRPRAARRRGRPGRRCLLLRTMLGIHPADEYLVVDPAVPESIGRIELLDIPGRWGRVDAFGRGRVDTARVAKRTGRRA